MASFVMVMYLGLVMEQGPVDDIFHAPKHPYTQALLRSIPSVSSQPRVSLPTISGSIPHPFNKPRGVPSIPAASSACRAGATREPPRSRRWEKGSG